VDAVADDESTEDLPFVPLDDDDIVQPDDDVAEAAASALAAGVAPSIAAVAAPSPTGLTWVFDFDARRFVTRGGRPAEARGGQALVQRVMLAVHTSRFRYDVLPRDFGFDRFDDIVGTVAYEDAIADFERRMRECVQSVPGCTDIEDFDASYDSTQGVFAVQKFTIITDTGERLPVGPVVVPQSGVL
jgi:hypothetical protein